jgi:hypothetical protein
MMKKIIKKVQNITTAGLSNHAEFWWINFSQKPPVKDWWHEWFLTLQISLH